MTLDETEALERMADRIEKHFDEKVTAMTALAAANLALHAATCPTKAAVEEDRAQAKGRKAVWLLLFSVGGLVGSMLGPFLKDAVAALVHRL